MMRAVFSRVHVPGRRMFSSKIINPIHKGVPKPIPALKSCVDSHQIDNKALLEKHSKDREWSQDEIKDAVRKHSLTAWGASNTPLVHISHGEGPYLYTHDGHRLLDFNCQAMCTNQGHSIDPSILDAIVDQLKSVPMLYSAEFSSDIRGKLSDLMASIMPGDINSFFYTAGGAEANEAAIRMAKMITGRHKIVSRYRSYHGSMGTTLELTGDMRRWYNEPATPGVVRVHDPYPYTFEWGETEEEITAKNLQYLRETLEYEGPSRIACIIMESVTGTNGILKPPKGYMEGVRALCDEFGIIMIADEVMAGFGRTGQWFGFMHTDPVILPDLVTMAKGINGAVLPLGCVATRQHVADFFQTHAIGTGTTYNAHPTVLASAYASLKVMLEQDLVGNAARMEGVVQKCIEDLAAKHPCVKSGRSTGLFSIIELQKNSKGDPFAHYNQAHEAMGALKSQFLQNGLFSMCRFSAFFVNPPLNITEEQIHEGFEIIDKSLTAAVDPHFEG